MKRIYTIAAAALVLGLLPFLVFRPKNEALAVHPQYLPLVEAVYASGNVVSHSEYKITSQADGYLAKTWVSAGDSIVMGQALFQISPVDQEIRKQAARTLYELTRRNSGADSPVLADLKIAIAKARVKLSNDSTNFARYQMLWENKATTKAEYDRAELALSISKEELKSLGQKYRQTQNQLAAELENAKSQWQLAQRNASDLTIKSAVTGRVFEIYKEPGEMVRRTETLALAGDAHHMYLKLFVDEMDVQKISLGQEALISVDMYPDRHFKAIVKKIYPVLNKNEQNFRVDAEFVGLFPAQFTGLTAEADIIIQQKNNTLTMPRRYLTSGDSVWVKRNKEKMRVAIKKGIETTEKVEILSGLTETDELLAN